MQGKQYNPCSEAFLVVVIPRPILNSLRSSGPPVAKNSKGETLRPGVASPKSLPGMINGEYDLLVDGENDEP